jgi:hypothetical protein
MEIKRLSSEIAKLISRIARSRTLPEGWSASDFVSLIGSYKDLVETIKSDGWKGTGKDLNVDQIMQVGIPGSYEAMEARNRQRVVGPAKRKN